MNTIRTHRPDETNPLFCAVCGAAIEGEERGACPVEVENDDSSND